MPLLNALANVIGGVMVIFLASRLRPSSWRGQLGHVLCIVLGATALFVGVIVLSDIAAT